MEKTYRIEDLLKLARQNQPLPESRTHEEYLELLERYKRKFGRELNTWLIGTEDGVTEFIVMYCLKTGIPVGDDECPEGSDF